MKTKLPLCRIGTLIFVVICIIGLLPGCYSYLYYDCTPSRIMVAGGELHCHGSQLYYDSTIQGWESFVSKKPTADIAWYLSFIYDEVEDTTRYYLLSIDSLMLYSANGVDSLLIPKAVDNFDEIKNRREGFCSFGPLRIREEDFPTFNIRGMLLVKDFEDKHLIDSIPLNLKAKLKKGHGSEFMR